MSLGMKSGLDCAHALMGRVHRGGGSLADEYPLVFREGFPGRVVALGEGADVRSACAILERPLLVDGARVRAGLIGSVSTDPAYRHQGLATRVLLQAEQELRDRGCLFSLLWADDPRYYFARGYRPIGWEVDLTLGPATAARIDPVPVRPARTDDAADIHRLYEQHERRVARTAEETTALLECPGMKTLVAEQDGHVLAYGCVGRGGDLSGTVHEWGGPTDLVLGIARAHHGAWSARSGSGELFVMSSPDEHELIDRCIELGAEVAHGILGLGKLLDRRAGAELLQSRAASGTRVEIDPAGRQSPSVRLIGPTGEQPLDDDSILGLLFPSRGSRDGHTAIAARTGAHLREPLLPYVWGLDSI